MKCQGRASLIALLATLKRLRLYRFSLRHVLLLALLNVVSGWLSLKLATPPGYVSAVFPPAGIALAAMLVWGGGVWPGIFLGSFCLNILVGLNTPAGIATGDVELAALIAAGSTLQAMAALLLVQLVVPGAPRLRDARRVVVMLLLGGPVACLIASATGSTGLLMFGKISAGSWGFTLWTWWVGDTLGVILCTPQFLVLAQLTQSNRRAMLLTVIAPSLTMLALVVMLFVQASNWELQRLENSFRSQATPVIENLQQDLASYQNAVDSVRRFMENSRDVSPAAYTNFTRELRQQYPGILAIEVAPAVSDSGRAAFEQRARNLGYADFAIHQRGPDGKMVPASERPVYYPIFYIEPLEGYRFLQGYDLASNQERLQTLLKARDTHQTAVTSRIFLISTQRDGMLVMSPAYTQNADGSPGDFQGVAMGVFDLETVIAHTIPRAIRRNIIVAIDDVTNPGHPDPIYLGQGRGSSLPGLSLHVPLHLADRHWLLHIAASETFIAGQSLFVSWLVLAAGLLFTGVLQMLLLAMSGYARNIQEEVDARTHELAESEARLSIALREQETLLKEVYHRVKNNLQVIYSLLNLEGYGLQEGAAKDALQNTAARVRAMALVHEKLYRSGSLASISLADYLKDLVQQIKGANADQARHIGIVTDIADLQIGLDSAIPLGLLVNELISNSLKHGFPTAVSGNIRVSLQTAGAALRLTIRDDGIGMPPDFDVQKSGSMGLRLASSLARQLGGELLIGPGPGAGFQVDFRLN